MAKLALLGGKSVVADPEQPKLNPLTSGPGQEFVERFCEYTGATYARCFSWGTWAITASMVAAEVGPGDEVICPSFTWAASVNPILHVNGIPIFAEVDPKTYTIDPADVERKITDRTKAIVAVDYYGHPADIPALLEIARPRGIVVIEDACQATGADIDGRKVGNLADMTCFSFAGKPISATSGGVWTTNNHHYYERALVAGEHTSFLCQLDDKTLRDRYTPTLGYGFKSRIDPHAAGIAMEQLRTLDERNDGRIANCNFMTEAFRNMFGFTPAVLSLLREEFSRFLQEQGSQITSEFYIPTALDTFIKRGTVKAKVLPTTESWFGITYREDTEQVRKSIARLIEKGSYPEALWT